MHSLTLDLMNLEGGLLRLLGATERRGWRAVQVHARTEGDRLAVQLTVVGAGSVELLCRQLCRLHEVAQVTAVPALERVSA